MVYLTGDCHGNFQRFTKKQRIRGPHFILPEDSVIVCGDLGLLWARDREFKFNLDWLSRLPFQLLWVQGNHENYDMIADYPLELWNGGKVRHIVRDKIILLERGQVFDIEGKRFFAFGGASSHDIQGGILDRNSPTYDEERMRAVRRHLTYRVRNESWWEQELPTEDELCEGRENLSKVGYVVDYVITHCMAGRMQDKLAQHDRDSYLSDRVYERDILTDYFDELEERLQYQRWFCGHYHVNLALDDKHTILYNRMIRLSGDFSSSL